MWKQSLSSFLYCKKVNWFRKRLWGMLNISNCQAAILYSLQLISECVVCLYIIINSLVRWEHQVVDLIPVIYECFMGWSIIPSELWYFFILHGIPTNFESKVVYLCVGFGIASVMLLSHHLLSSPQNSNNIIFKWKVFRFFPLETDFCGNYQCSNWEMSRASRHLPSIPWIEIPWNLQTFALFKNTHK